MATSFLTIANKFLPSLPSTSSSPPLPKSPYHVTRKPKIVCKATANEASSIDTKSPPWSFLISRRSISLNFIAATTLMLGYRGCSDANAAIFERSGDDELLYKLKGERKKRLEAQGPIDSSDNEKALLQELVNKLGKLAKSLEKEDFSEASSILNPGLDAEWVQKVNFALNQLSDTGEERKEVDNININLSYLTTAVTNKDIPASKAALVATASAFKKWTTLNGVGKKLKGI